MSNSEVHLAATNLAPVFAAPGDKTRLSLLAKLSDGQARPIAGLWADTSMTRQALTRHLHVLESAGLLQSERIGRESQFTIRPDAMTGARSWLDRVSAQWDDALARLRAFVEP